MNYSQVQYRIDTHLDASASVLSMHVEEELNACYRAKLLISVDDRDTSASDLLGRAICLRWGRGETEHRLNGLVRAIAPRSDDHSVSRFELEIVPALWMLSLRRDTRIFQDKSVSDILEDVLSSALGDYDRELRLELDETYEPREYCVQYQESDLDFVQRLMEEEGIGYAFDQEGEAEVLVLRDRNAAYGVAPGLTGTIAYEPNSLVLGQVSAGHFEPMHRFQRSHRAAVTEFCVRDFDWTSPSQPIDERDELQDAESVHDAIARARERYEHGLGRSLSIGGYDDGSGRYQEENGAKQATHRLEAARLVSPMGQGISRVTTLSAGTTFELSGHPGLGVDGQYLVTRVVHHDRPVSEVLGGGTDADVDNYYNEVQCVPLAQVYRPLRRTRKPFIGGVQTAVVTGPSGEEIHTDQHARICVRFHWDRSESQDERSSCWIRTQQKWAGPGYGFLWLPRIGMEVIVQFIDGDPDRPLVTGSVYNGENLPPYRLPDEKTKSTIKSNSSLGGSGFNELRFEDRAGSEEVYTHAQRDYNEVVENDHTTRVGNDQEILVHRHQNQEVGVDQGEQVDVDQKLTVDGNRSVHVVGNFAESIAGNETRQVDGDVVETLSANETRTIAADVSESIGADEERLLEGNMDESIGANLNLDISGNSDVLTVGDLSETIGANITTMTPGSWTVTSGAGVTITVPGGANVIGPGGWMIAAPGGVQQTDSQYAFLGGTVTWTGAFGRSICGAKFEAFGAAFGFTAQKIGFSGGTVPNGGISFEMGVNSKGERGVTVKMAAADVHTWGAEMDD